MISLKSPILAYLLIFSLILFMKPPTFFYKKIETINGNTEIKTHLRPFGCKNETETFFSLHIFSIIMIIIIFFIFAVANAFMTKK